jgi:glycosyltransferase involved in cell wall biosynthesis
MQDLAARPEIDLTVYFYSSYGLGSTPDPHFGRTLYTAESSLAGYHSLFLRNYSPRPGVGPFFAWIHPGVVRELFRNYDAVIMHGWWGASNLLAYLTAFARGLPVLVHSDRNAMVAHASRYRTSALDWLFRKVSAFLVVGKRNAVFYRQHGVPDAKMFLSPLAVDNDFYTREAARLAPERPALRRQLGIAPGEFAILYVGRFVPEKGVPDLLTAFQELAATRAHLVLAGDGPEGGRLREFVAAHHLERVHFVGSKSYEELPAYYALADVLVVPSHTEPWAVVVNEAMNFALPVIASQQVGAADDLVSEGVNGFRFEAGDTATLAARLRRLMEDPPLRRQMGEASLPIIREWNFGRATEGVLAALRSLRPNRG